MVTNDSSSPDSSPAGATTSLVARIRAGLEWPQWNDWAASSPPTGTTDRQQQPTAVAPVNTATRRAEVASRRALARTNERGGPYVEIYDAAIAQRIAEEDDDDLGPLAMWTFAVKDLVAVSGHRMSAGSPVRVDAPHETHTAPIVSMIEELGAICMGSVTLHEFAFGVTGINSHQGTAPNPAAPGRLPGGSSSGSASAVADGSARIAIGTDTGGSVRIPAAFCGVVGFKPAFGTYPNTGVFPLSATLDHVGLLATTTADISHVHQLLGHETISARRPKRLGIVRVDLEAASAEVQSAFGQAIQRLRAAGVEIVDVEWNDPESVFVASTAIMFSEAAAIHAHSLSATPDRYGHDIKARLKLGSALTGVEVASAHRLRSVLQQQTHAALAGVDAIVSPTVQIVAPLLEDADDPTLAARIVANTRLANVVGLPAISLPIANDGPPVGLQLLGPSNATVLALAEGVEALMR